LVNSTNLVELHQALTAELFTYALQHPAPAVAVVITSDRDFAVALHKLSGMPFSAPTAI
jgi:hypothetical protein